MIAAACPVASSGSTVSGSCVIHAATFVPSTPPVATARSTSRSVRIPERCSPVHDERRSHAALMHLLRRPVERLPASTVSNVFDITSPTFAISVP